MCVVVLLLLSASLPLVLCECDSTGGSWISDKNSQLHLIHRGSTLSGSFNAHTRLSGQKVDQVKHFAVNGIYSKDGLIAYTINFDTSVGAFVGQCFTQDNEDVMKVTWLIKTKANSSNEYWMTTRVGEDIFKRKQTTAKQKRSEEERKDDEEE